ncbi:hypothetical protein AB3N59_04215 [Leptospira sp. WS92.C1]
MKYVETLEYDSFLMNLPDSILSGLDLGVLMIPTVKQKSKIGILESTIGSYIALYKKNVEPDGLHLCKTIQSANLNPSELEILSRFEKEEQRENEPIVIAYHKPILLSKQAAEIFTLP